MKKLCNLTTLRLLTLLLLSLLTKHYLYGQELPPTQFPCGTTVVHEEPSGPMPLVPVGSGYSPFPTSAIVNCGSHFQIYYEDIAEGILSGNHAGFDDPVYGVTRRNTFCAVLTYIEQTFDFSHISPLNPIRIQVMRSFDPIYNPVPSPGPTTPPTPFNARSFPDFDQTSDGIKDSRFAEYVLTGVDPIPGSYHARIQVNFHGAHRQVSTGYWVLYNILWHNDGSTPVGCGETDLYSTLLHELGHDMGWSSMVAHTGTDFTGQTPGPSITTHNVFTRLDAAIRVGGNSYPLTTSTGGFLPLITTSGGAPIINPAVLAIAPVNNQYWINDLEAPNNYPVYSGNTLPYGVSSQLIAHLDGQNFTYSVRSRVSPGTDQIPVMGPFLQTGVERRKYTRADLFGFHNIMGYDFAATFSTVNPLLDITNHPPFSQKMASYNITRNNFAYFTEIVAADYSLVNNSGAFIDIDVSTMTDLVDADGDPISIEPSSLLNFRGCGIGGNNHDALTWIVPGEVLRFTPRADFYGKAQFGFDITDGIDRGSFVVVTIEVTRGTNVTCSPGDNMICNSGYEEGTQVATTLNPFIANTTDGPYREGRWQGITFSDSHPYNFDANFSYLNIGFSLATGSIVQGYWIVECAGIYNDMVGSRWLGAPNTEGSSIDNPSPPTSSPSGERYQSFNGGGSSYYYLKIDAEHCKRYLLECDLYLTTTGEVSPIPLEIAFTNDLTDPRMIPTPLPVGFFNFQLNYTQPVTAHEWVHVSIPITYCGSTPSNLLYIRNTSDNVIFHVDNISLKEVTTPPLTVVATVQDPVACSTTITTTVDNSLCTLSYLWGTADGVILSSPTESSISVPVSVPATYTVTVNDGCGIANDEAVITTTPTLPITGPAEICTGSVSTLSSGPTGGSWTSSNSSVASVDPTGIVTGIAAGSAEISYTLCSQTESVVITVFSMPSAISGILSVCEGSTTTLTNAVPDGAWSSSNVAVATVSATGVVTGEAAGTATITYATSSMCYVTETIIVNPQPGAIDGITSICAGNTTTLTNPILGGTWSSADPFVVSIDGSSGLLTGENSGTVEITYSMPGGCFSTVTMTVVGPTSISGSAALCNGLSSLFTCSPAGGTWSVSDPLVLTIGAASGMSTGLSVGTATIIYTLGSCSRTKEVVVNVQPAAIAGPANVCEGSSITLSNSVAGGTWSSTHPANATIDAAGMVAGIAGGTTQVSYSMPEGCYALKNVVVNVIPGPFTAWAWPCTGVPFTMASSTPGGSWTSSDPAVATVDAVTGTVLPLTLGPTVITYSFPATGCFRTWPIIVYPQPEPIVGPTTLCLGETTIYSCSTPGGTWHGSEWGDYTGVLDYGAVVVDAVGNGVGFDEGIGLVSYELPGGCFSQVTVNIHPVPATITGVLPLCVGGSITLSTASTGGTWSSSTPAVATIVASTGVATGIAPGVTNISYAFPTGCSTTVPLTVSPLPDPITGPAAVCLGSNATYTHSAPGGIWSSSDPAILSITSTGGIATGIASGSATITYSLPFAGCFVTQAVVVNPLPSAVTGGNKVCVGNTITLNSTPAGGTWTMAPSPLATLSTAGVVSGLSIGTIVVTYSHPVTGCQRTHIVTIGPAVTPITGNNAICFGNTMTLSHPVPGGTWSTLTPSLALIGAADGIVVPAPPGTPPYTSPSVAIVQYVTEPGCSTTYQFSVFHNDGQCSPCNPAQFGSGTDFSLLPGGPITAGTMTGNYYLAGDATVQSHLVLQDAVVFIKPGVKVAVDPAYSLTSNGSHLFTCSTGMWKGIELKTGPTVSGPRTARAVLQGSTGNDYGTSTLIEDAETAISVVSPEQPNDGGDYFIESRNTIFNHNNNGIYVENYTHTSSTLPGTPEKYEFLIENTTFTCRNIGATTPGFPLSWPGNYGAGGMKTYTTPATPYEPSKYVTNYTYSLCHNGLPAYTGIKLNKVGVTTGSIYTSIQIGSPSTPGPYSPSADYAPEPNLFDALGHGIWALNTNLKVRNSMFEKMKTTVLGPIAVLGPFIEQTGVYTEMNNAQKYELDVQPVTSGYGIDAVTATNSFYDCAYGIYSKNYNRITCNSTNMRSTQVFGSGSGSQGIVLQSPSYEQVQVNDNTMYNLKNGISFVSSYTGGMYVPAGPDLWVWALEVSHLGNLEINDNRIQAAVGTTIPTTQYVSFAIAVQNSLPTPSGFTSTATGEVHTDGNNIKDAFRGILVNGYKLQPAKSKNNTITVRPAPVPFGTPMQKGWGIDHTNNLKGIISGNTVTGVWSGNNDPLNDSIRAYLCELNSSETVSCNYADNTGRGYEFFHDNPATWWLKNEIVKHMKGYMLNYSHIGPQGWSGFNFENTWTNTSWWGLSSGKYQTFVAGSPYPTASQLYVSPGILQEPTINWGDAGAPPTNAYSPSTIHAATGYQYITCQSDVPISSGGATARAGAYEPTVKDMVVYTAHADARKWIAQYAAWEAVNIDTVLTDSSAVLAQFKTMAAGSRMAYLSDIELALATGDLTTAAALIATPPSPLSPALCIDTTTGVDIKDDSTVDYIIDKNRELYDIYLRYLQYTMDSVDTASIPVIAQLCPLRYGSVVYRARALYTAVYNDLEVWCENCEDMEGEEEQQGGQKPMIKTAMQGDGMQVYALFPNPNDGNLLLVQKLADTGVVSVDVSDVLGRSVYKQQVRFMEKSHHLSLQNIASGMYVTTVIDGDGRKYTFKFVKQ